MRLFVKFVLLIWILMISIALIPTFLINAQLVQKGYTGFERFFGVERINIVFETEHGTEVIGIVTDGSTSKWIVGGVENPTVVIRCNSTVAKEIMNSDNKLSKVIDAIINGDVVVVKSNSSIFSFISEFSGVLKTLKSLSLLRCAWISMEPWE